MNSQIAPNELVTQLNQEFLKCLDAVLVNPEKDTQIPKEGI